jgi:hypothetical protein
VQTKSFYTDFAFNPSVKTIMPTKKKTETESKNWFDDIETEKVKKVTDNTNDFIRLPEPDEAGIYVIIENEPHEIETKNGKTFVVDAIKKNPDSDVLTKGSMFLPKSLRFQMAVQLDRKNQNFKTGISGTKWRIWSNDETGQKFYNCELL